MTDIHCCKNPVDRDRPFALYHRCASSTSSAAAGRKIGGFASTEKQICGQNLSVNELPLKCSLGFSEDRQVARSSILALRAGIRTGHGVSLNSAPVR